MSRVFTPIRCNRVPLHCSSTIHDAVHVRPDEREVAIVRGYRKIQLTATVFSFWWMHCWFSYPKNVAPLNFCIIRSLLGVLFVSSHVKQVMLIGRGMPTSTLFCCLLIGLMSSPCKPSDHFYLFLVWSAGSIFAIATGFVNYRLEDTLKQH